MGHYPGEETPVIPDVVDAVDAGDVVEGILSQSGLFFAKSTQLHSAKTDETSFGDFVTIRMGCFPVLKTPITPDEVDVVDAGNGVEGLGWVVCVGLSGGLRDFLPADGQMGNKELTSSMPPLGNIHGG